MLDHSVAHFPKLPLLSGTARREGCLHRVVMHVQRKVHTDIPQLASGNVFFAQLLESRLVMTPAEGTLVVRELDHDQRRIHGPKAGGVRQQMHTDWLIRRNLRCDRTLRSVLLLKELPYGA